MWRDQSKEQTAISTTFNSNQSVPTGFAFRLGLSREVRLPLRTVEARVSKPKTIETAETTMALHPAPVTPRAFSNMTC